MMMEFHAAKVFVLVLVTLTVGNNASMTKPDFVLDSYNYGVVFSNIYVCGDAGRHWLEEIKKTDHPSVISTQTFCLELDDTREM